MITPRKVSVALTRNMNCFDSSLDGVLCDFVSYGDTCYILLQLKSSLAVCHYTAQRYSGVGPLLKAHEVTAQAVC